MKQIIHIARAELKHLVYSPLAWAASFVLFLFFAVDYINVLHHYATVIEGGGMGVVNDIHALTSKMTLFCPGLAWFVRLLMMHSKFAVPFIMMGLVSREYSSGTIRLIYSSPITTRTFIWGKFFGAAAFCLAIILLFSVLVIAFCLSIGSPDIGLLAWQLFSTFLYYVFIASVCLFASSLSQYPIVGGVVSILILLTTSVINGIGQRSVLADFFFPLSHQGAVHRLVSGGVDMNDLIFLLVFTLLFVQLTIIKIENSTRNLNNVRKTLRFSAVIAVALAIIVALPYTPIAYLDLSREKRGTLNKQMQQILASMNEGPLEITHYVNIIFPDDDRTKYYIPESRASIKYNTWREYMRYKKDITVKFRYYYAADTSSYEIRSLMKAYNGLSDEAVARIMADTYGFDMDEVHTVDEIKKEIDLADEEYSGHLIKLKYRNRETLLRTSVWGFPGHLNIYPALERLVSGRGKELFFVLDGKTRQLFYKSRESYATTEKKDDLGLTNWRNTGPLLDSLRLTDRDIPAATRSLVLMGPRENIPGPAMEKLKKYIDDGGNMLIAGEPEYRQFVQPLLDYVGVTMKKEVMAQPTEKFGSSRMLGALSYASYPYMWQFDSLQKDYKRIHWDTLNIAVDGCGAFDASKVTAFKVVPLAYNHKEISWNLPALQNYDSLSFVLKKKPGDEEGSFPLLLLLTRQVNGKEQKIVISGDVDFIRGIWFPQLEYTFNREFNTALLSVLSNNAFPLNLSGKPDLDNYYKIGLRGVEAQRVLFLYFAPAIILLAGVILIYRRRRK